MEIDSRGEITAQDTRFFSYLIGFSGENETETERGWAVVDSRACFHGSRIRRGEGLRGSLEQRVAAV